MYKTVTGCQTRLRYKIQYKEVWELHTNLSGQTRPGYKL